MFLLILVPLLSSQKIKSNTDKKSKKLKKKTLGLPTIMRINFSAMKGLYKRKATNSQTAILYSSPNKLSTAPDKSYFHKYLASPLMFTKKFLQLYRTCWRLPCKNATRTWEQPWWKTWFSAEAAPWSQVWKIEFIVNWVTLEKIWEFNLTGREGIRLGLVGAWLGLWVYSSNWPLRTASTRLIK